MKSWTWVLLAVALLAAAGGGAVLVDEAVLPYVKRFAEAIAHAEGFGVPDSLSSRYNNPGDLTKDITGTAVGAGDQHLMIYASAADGWAALYAQVASMFDGTSLFYRPTMTISQIAKTYAGDWVSWANNVASYLGVSTDTVLSDLIEGGA